MKLYKQFIFVIIILRIAFSINQDTDITINWTYECDYDVMHPPVIDSLGNIYYADEKKLVALDTLGQLRWQKELGHTSDIWAHNNRIIVSDKTSNIYFYNPDGSRRKSGIGGDFLSSSLNLVLADLYQEDKFFFYYFGSGYEPFVGSVTDYSFVAKTINNNLWHKKIGGVGQCSNIVIGKNKVLYFGINGKLYAIDSEGEILWTFDLNYTDITNLIMDENGVLYFGNTDGTNSRIYAINYDGKYIFKNSVSGEILYSPIIDNNRKMYFTTDAKKLCAINLDNKGREYWTVDLDEAIQTAPILDSDNNLYFKTKNFLQVYDNTGNEMQKIELTGATKSKSPYIDNTGNLLISADNVIYSYNFGKKLQDAGSYWPKIFKNNQNDMNMYNPDAPVAILKETILTGNGGDQIFLDGSGSFDPDGDELYFQWQIIEQPLGANLIFDSPNSSTTTMTLPSGFFGDYIVSLNVFDKDDGYTFQRCKIEGSKLKILATSSYPLTKIALMRNGNILFTENEHGIKSVGENGSTNWQYSHYYRGDTWQTFDSRFLFVDDQDRPIFVFYNSGPGGHLNFLSTYNNGIENIFTSEENYSNMDIIYNSGKIYYSLHNYQKDCILSIDTDSKNSSEIVSDFLKPWFVGIINNEMISSTYDHLYSYNKGSNSNWEIALPRANNYYFGAIGSDGRIYLSASEKIIVVNSDGEKLWEKGLASNTQPVIDEVGNIYFGTKSGMLYKFDKDGNQIWGNTYNSKALVTPLIGSNGTIFFGTGDRFFAVNPDGTEKWVISTTGNVTTPPAMNDDGILYFGTDKGNLYSIQTECSGLANSPWPKHDVDNQNTRTVRDTSKINNSPTPSQFKLHYCYPNPFNATTTIKYDLPENRNVKVAIYNSLGKKVEVLLNEFQQAGSYKYSWTANNLPSGIYFISVEADIFSDVTKCVLLK